MRLVIALFLVGFLFYIPVSARILHVPSEYVTIQGGIDESANGDTVLVNDGHYYERISFLGKAITVASRHLLDGDSAHIANTIIDADTAFLDVADTASAVSFVNGEESTSILQGFTIQNGIGTHLYLIESEEEFPYYTDTIDCRCGGGIVCVRSNPVITNCRIEGNSAERGGGLYAVESRPKLEFTTIRDNHAGSGGGLSDEFSGFGLGRGLEIRDCAIDSNYSPEGAGVLSKYSDIYLYNSAIDHNIAGDGILALRCFLSMDSCQVSENDSAGIGAHGPTQRSSHLQLTHSIISNNGAEGIYSYGGNARTSNSLLGCEISGNTLCGIRFEVDDPSVTIDSCSIKNNRNGGIYFGVWAYFRMKNSILAGNSATLGGAINFYNGSVPFIENCLFEGNSAMQGGAIYYCSQDRKNILDDWQSGFTNCTFTGNSASDGSVFYISDRNSFGRIPLTNCILSANGPGPVVGCGGDHSWTAPISCTDIFGNPGGDWVGCIDSFANINGNFSENPYFCDTTNHDYHIFAGSRCAPENNECQSLIGALGVGCQGLNAFSPIAPPSGTVYVGAPIYLIWASTTDPQYPNPTFYRVYIDDDPAFLSVDSSDVLTDTTFIINGPLERATTYFWKVQAFDYHAPPLISAATWSFHIDGFPGQPIIFAPENGRNADSATIFSWLVSIDPDSLDAVSYTIQIDNDPAFASPEIDQSGLRSGILLDDAFAIRLGDLEWFSNLQIDTRYLWRVRAEDNYGLQSDWTDGTNWFVFMPLNDPPNPPVSGFSPANFEEIISLTPTLSWDDATDPDDVSDSLRHICDVFTELPGIPDGGFYYFFYDTTGPGINRFDVPDTLFDNFLITYRVKTLDPHGLTSDWSENQFFWTNHHNFPPEPFLLYEPQDNTWQVEYYTRFSWDGAYDYDPNSIITFTIEISQDILFDHIIWSQSGLTDISLAIVTDSIPLIGYVYWRAAAVDDDGLRRIGGIPEESRELTILLPGDANCDGRVTGLDVVYLVAYLKGGPPPCIILAGDANGNCQTTGLDVVYLVNYLKGIGTAPIRPNCEPAILLHDNGQGDSN